MKQKTLFGGYREITPEKSEREKKKDRLSRMQKKHGVLPEDKTCGDCSGIKKIRLGERYHYKCRWDYQSNGLFTDIKPTDRACGFYMGKDEL